MTLSTETPFICVEAKATQTTVSGDLACSLGHKIDGGNKDKPDGVFAEWSWDGHALRIRNDRYGFLPIFYACEDRKISVSTSIPALLARGAPRELDDSALAVFLRLGFFLGEDTAFRSIRALPPDAKLEWADGALTLSGGYVRQRPLDISQDEAIDRYIRLFKRSILRRVPLCNDFALPLSGGRDSRHILLELCAIGSPPKFCVTVRNHPPHPDESISAARLASAAKVKHVVVAQPESWLDSELAKNELTSFCADEHAWYMPLAKYLKGKAHCFYDGIGGDVLSAGLFLNRQRLALFHAGQFDELALLLMKEFAGWNHVDEPVVEAFLTRDGYKKMHLTVAAERLVCELQKHADEPNPVSSFFFWNRTRREIALSPYGIFKEVGNALTPYLDAELFDFLSSLRASFFLDHSFHTETIARAYPAFATIPYHAEESRPAGTSRYKRLFCGEFLSYLARHRRGQILVRSGYFVPKLIYGLTTGEYRNSWPSPRISVYLVQLALAANRN